MLSVCQTNKHCRVPRLVCTLCRPLSSAHHYHCSLPLAPLQLQSQSSLQHFANASAEKLDSVSRLDLCRELGPGRDLREGREGAVTLTNQRPALANISQSEASSPGPGETRHWAARPRPASDSHTANIYWSWRHRARNK